MWTEQVLLKNGTRYAKRRAAKPALGTKAVSAQHSEMCTCSVEHPYAVG